MSIRISLFLCTGLISAALAQDPAPTPNGPAKAPLADGAEAADSSYLPAQAFEGSSESSEPPRARAITLHPAFSLAISGLNISYEAPLGRGLWTYELPFYLGYNERVYNNPYFFIGSGFTVRHYLIERGAGAYFAPSLDMLNVHRFKKGPEPANNLLIVAPNLRMGYRWTWKSFTMDASAGVLYYETLLTQGQRSDDDWEIRRGLFPMTQFALGVPF